MVIVDAIARLLPGVVGNEFSVKNDSFYRGILDHPHYTRPEEFRGKRVPEVLLSGHHKNIENWRRREAIKRTLKRRPELLEKLEITEEDKRILEEIKEEING